jgi:hypothetical protein
MGHRCRFVQGAIVRLDLVDVHRRAYQALVEKGVPVPADWPKGHGPFRPATDEELATAQARIAAAEADGDWIDVKKELTAGEQRHIFTGLVKQMHLGEKTELDPDQLGKTKLLEYIVGWSFVSFDGQPEPVSESAIDCLDIDTYNELLAAVEAHETAEAARREDRKKTAGIGTTSSVISESPAL